LDLIGFIGTTEVVPFYKALFIGKAEVVPFYKALWPGFSMAFMAWVFKDLRNDVSRLSRFLRVFFGSLSG
jgi:hypothetical protein